MSLQGFDKSLVKYNNKLKEISIDYIDYNALNSAVLIFFEEINALDKNFLEYYFINLTKENVKKNFVHEYAFSYFILLTIKNISPSDFLARFFPEFVELESAPRSNWWVVRWLQIFIAWIIKPKSKLSNFPEAKTVLDALRDIRHRIQEINNKLLDVKLEMQYKSLNLIEKKIIESKASPLIYISINEQHVISDWLISCIHTLKIARHCKEFLVEYSEEHLEIDTLLKYLKYRIKLLLDSEEKTKLLNEYIKVQDFVFKKEFSLFESKVCEIKKFIKRKSGQQNTVKIQGIYHLLEGIKLRLKIICEVNDEAALMNNHQNHLTDNFKQLMNIRMDKIRFFYEAHRKNLDIQIEFCYGNISKVYEILNKLESILYTDKNLFFHSSRDFASLAASFKTMLSLIKELENCAKAMDPKPLENDMHQLSQFILAEILFLYTALEKEFKENIPLAVYDSNDCDSEWDNESDISVTSNVEQLEPEENLIRESIFIAEQFDSGVSSEDESNSVQTTRSYLSPKSTLFRQNPFRQENSSEMPGVLINGF
ncbi:hypothetical protein [Rickettsiella endosymbiont of Xylota segnis]|uniref:hypothetical protein n=1 Tax=Rickettsiella endosymbiont of Xylota segnis TaxID=3066238 RepID=UPI0030D228D7